MADVFEHLAELDELIAANFIVLIQSALEDIALSHLEVTNAFSLSGVHGTDLRTQAFTEVIQSGADGQAVFGESGLAAAVNDLEEQFSHSDVDCVTYEVGIEGFEDGLAGKDLGCHSCGVGHTGTSDGLDEGLFDDAVFNVQGQFAGALLRSAPAHTVSQTGNILDFIGFHPFAFFRDRSRAMLGAFCNDTHILDLRRISHCDSSFLFYQAFPPRLIRRFCKSGDAFIYKRLHQSKNRYSLSV